METLGFIYTPETIGEQVIFWSAVVVAAGALIEVLRRLLRRLWRFGRWAYAEVKEELERRRRIDALLERELKPNGGSSMKDVSADLAKVPDQIQSLGRSIDGVRADVAATRHATGVVLDTLNAQHHDEISKLWRAVAQLGVDRRTTS